MRSAGLKTRRSYRRDGGVFACAAAILVLCAPMASPARAQNANPLTDITGVAADQQLLMEADELRYDFDNKTVTALGGVQIYYGAYVLEAEKVTYFQSSGRLIASGGVWMLEPGGNVVTAETVDITDDFRDGFVERLNVMTIDRARFAAESAERQDGNLLIFRKGVYTACEPCLKNPSKPPLWQIKAARIIHDRQARTIYYENARLEFFGVPIAYTPFFFHADPTVKRKTGFLTPRFRESEALGSGISAPFFWNLAPNYDLTLTPTAFTKQGLLMEGEWRHRVLNGSYSVRAAGIFQGDKEVFVDDDGERLSGYRDFRGSLHTDANFAINSRWSTGWDLTIATDPTFNRDYSISGLTARDVPTTVYLTGISDRNFFDLRAYYFFVQRENTVENYDVVEDDKVVTKSYTHDDQAEQAAVHPVLDHNYVLDSSIFGGELSFDSNLTSLTRPESDRRPSRDGKMEYYAGIEGTYGRATTRASWRRELIAPGGQVLTPFTYLQADVAALSADDRPSDMASDELVVRGMPALGLQYEWPFLAMAGSSVHTFGPKAQIIVRPDEQHAGDLPNEDAQSLVYDDTTLFEWDKFSGYDRQEGGTRLNYALTYQGLFGNGASLDALFGQSIQLAGTNSFSEYDHALTGLGSGLDDDVSDYIGRITLNTGNGLSMTARGRFDDEDLTVNRSEVTAVAARGRNVASLGYAYIRDNPSTGAFDTRQEVSAGAAVALDSNWTVSGSLVYDIEAESRVTHSIGLAYDDECFSLSATYSDTREDYSDLVGGREVFLRINLRTLGEGQLSSSLDE